jgi:hypothetical protein
VRVVEPAYTGALVSLVFQGEGSRSCSLGKHVALSSCVCWEAGLNTKQVPSNGAWSQVETSGGREIRSVELQVILPILPVEESL